MVGILHIPFYLRVVNVTCSFINRRIFLRHPNPPKTCGFRLPGALAWIADQGPPPSDFKRHGSTVADEAISKNQEVFFFAHIFWMKLHNIFFKVHFFFNEFWWLVLIPPFLHESWFWNSPFQVQPFVGAWFGWMFIANELGNFWFKQHILEEEKKKSRFTALKVCGGLERIQY